MALSFEDIEKLPDDVFYQLPDGTQVKLGDIREAAKEHVNKRISDLTPREQKVAAREKAVEEEAQKVREAMVVLANTPPSQPLPTTTPPPGTPPPPLGYTQQQWDAIKADPFSRPIVEALAMMASKLEETEKRFTDATASWQKNEDTRRQQAEQDWINYQFTQLASANEKYKDPATRQALLNFAKEVLTRRDISVLDKAMRYDESVKAAKDEGYQAGLKEGQSKAPIPSIPYSTKAAPVAAPSEKLPGTWHEFADQAANDPAFIQEIREASMQPPSGGG